MIWHVVDHVAQHGRSKQGKNEEHVKVKADLDSTHSNTMLIDEVNATLHLGSRSLECLLSLLLSFSFLLLGSLSA